MRKIEEGIVQVLTETGTAFICLADVKELAPEENRVCPGYNRYFFIADISGTKMTSTMCACCADIPVFLCRRNTGNRRGESTG